MTSPSSFESELELIRRLEAEIERVRKLGEGFERRNEPIPAAVDAELAEIEQRLAAILTLTPTIQ